ARREQDDVQSAVVGGGRVLDGRLAVTPGQGAPGGAGGGEEPQPGNGKLALGQDAAHDATDLPRRTYDADPHGHKTTACLPPREIGYRRRSHISGRCSRYTRHRRSFVAWLPSTPT